MKWIKREKKYSLPIKELDDYSTRIFHFVYEQKRLPTNQEMFMELKIPSASLEEVIHYFNHPPAPQALKKYEPEQIKLLDAQTILIYPFVTNEKINLTEVVIGLNYSTSNARELVNFCNTVIRMSENNMPQYFDLFETNDIELNVVRVIKKHRKLMEKNPDSIPILKLARKSHLGVLSTRIALIYYERNRLKIPQPSEISEARANELDEEIRNYFSDLLEVPSLSLESVLTHPNWKLPTVEPPELTVDNVTKIVNDITKQHKQRTKDPIVGVFHLAGDTVKKIVDTFIKPKIDQTIEKPITNPTLTHAQEILCVLQPIRDQEAELAPTYNVGLQTIEYVPAEQVKILKEKDRFFCSLCQEFYPKNDPHYDCISCQRSLCDNCYQVGMKTCPVCRGKLNLVESES